MSEILKVILFCDFYFKKILIVLILFHSINRDTHGRNLTSQQSETFLHRIVSFWDKNMLMGYFCRVFLEVFENFKFEVVQLHFEVLQLLFKNRIFIFMNSRYAC